MDYIHYKTKYNFYFAYKKYIFQIQLYVYKQVESTVHRYWIACLLYFWQGENKIPHKRLFLFKSAATRWFSVLTSISQCVFKSLNRDGASMAALIAHTIRVTSFLYTKKVLQSSKLVSLPNLSSSRQSSSETWVGRAILRCGSKPHMIHNSHDVVSALGFIYRQCCLSSLMRSQSHEWFRWR